MSIGGIFVRIDIWAGLKDQLLRVLREAPTRSWPIIRRSFEPGYNVSGC